MIDFDSLDDDDFARALAEELVNYEGGGMVEGAVVIYSFIDPEGQGRVSHVASGEIIELAGLSAYFALVMDRQLDSLVDYDEEAEDD